MERRSRSRVARGLFRASRTLFQGVHITGDPRCPFPSTGFSRVNGCSSRVGTTRQSSAASFVFGKFPPPRLHAFVDWSHYDRMGKRDEQDGKFSITYLTFQSYINPGFPHPSFIQSRSGVKGSRHTSHISRHRLSRFVGDLDGDCRSSLSSTASGIGLHLI